MRWKPSRAAAILTGFWEATMMRLEGAGVGVAMVLKNLKGRAGVEGGRRRDEAELRLVWGDVGLVLARLPIAPSHISK